VGVEDKPSRARRTIHILAVLLVAVVLPVLLMWALVGEFGAMAMFMGILLGGVGAKIGGTRRMLVLAPLMGLAAGLGATNRYPKR
jgi:nitrate reductase NapE component